MKKRTALFLGGLAALVAAGPVVAHHAFGAEFDRDAPIRMEGSITRLEWVNPHSWIHIAVHSMTLEGETIEQLKWNAQEAFPEPLIKVPDDLKNNVAVTSIDALLNWGRRSAVWPVAFGLACCVFEMIASAMSRFDISRFGMEAMRATPRQATPSPQGSHSPRDPQARPGPRPVPAEAPAQAAEEPEERPVESGG